MSSHRSARSQRSVPFALLFVTAFAVGPLAAQAQTRFTPFSCAYDERFCASPQEAAAAREKRKQREAVEHQRQLERELALQETEARRKALEQQLGAHRKAEIERLLKMREQARAQSAEERTAARERTRISCEATVKKFDFTPCHCVGLVPDRGGTACGM